MNGFKILKNTLLVAAFVFAQASSAAIVFDFVTPNGTETGSGFGNMYTFTDGSGLSVDVTSFGLTGNGATEFEAGEVGQFATGLGSCNASEGTNCNSPLHTADNIGQKEVLVLAFNQQVNFQSVELTNWGSDYIDLEYWIGTAPVPVALAGSTAANTTTGSSSNTTISSFGLSTYDYQAVDYLDIASFNLVPGSGNVLIVGATFGDPYDSGNDDRFKLTSVTVSAIPLPAAAWLFGSAVIGLLGVRRSRSSVI